MSGETSVKTVSPCLPSHGFSLILILGYITSILLRLFAMIRLVCLFIYFSDKLNREQRR